MINKKFVNWIVVNETKPDKEIKHKGRYYLCKCDCGTVKIVRADRLRSGRSTKCDNCRRQNFKSMVTTHGKHLTSTYCIWRGIIKRCTLPSHPSYPWYGAKGITFDPRWVKFENFLEDMGERPEGLQIDRIDTTGNYTKDNCRWVTSKENQNNRINNIARNKTPQ